VSLPRGRRDGQPARGRDGSGWPCPRAGPWAAARAPGTDPSRPARRDRSRRNRRSCHSSLGMLTPDRKRTSSQPDPARSMTRIRQPDSGKPRAHQSGKPGKLGVRRVLANPAAIWMTWRLTASEPPPTPRSVAWGDEAAALIFCPVVFRQLADSAGFSSMFRLVVLHIRERMPVSRASPASQASSPARRAAVRRSRG